MKGNAKGQLNQLEATAICGNDITSSCLYVAALSIVYAGQWAWVSLLMVSVVLYFYRSIYAEVVGALPLNGGAYNALLNTTSKFVASMAACFTILSYMATAVISANEAMHYLQSLWISLPVIPATTVLLAVFMTLMLVGISESAKVATGIFVLHLFTLGILILAGIWSLINSGLDIFINNIQLPFEGSLGTALFFGFSAAMLGISGFESSANFVEEQAPGVFQKTLRNMWITVTVINPTLAFLALALLPIYEIRLHQEALISNMGALSGGDWLAALVAIDATLVLSGAVLTSYVGVTGLVHRMVLDRCLPQFLLKVNRYGIRYRIVVAFFLLCLSVLLVTSGKLAALAGVYTISFLSVMVLFGVGNLLLKLRRSGLRRPVKAPWLTSIIAIIAVVAALLGTMVMNPAYVGVFFQYFLPTMIIVVIMLNRITLLKTCLFIIKSVSQKLTGVTDTLTRHIETNMDQINSQQFVFFTRGGNLSNLNLAMLYVQDNEHTNRMKIVNVISDGTKASSKLADDIKFLNRIYPEIDLEFIVHQGEFGPNLIQELSQKWAIPPNFMFMGSPKGEFRYSSAELGGVRLIM